MTAQYVFPSLPEFTKVVVAIHNGEESDVNGLWGSDILQTYFPYKPASPTYVMKPEVTHGQSRYDILVTRQIIGANTVTWPWVLIYEGKKGGSVSWDAVRAQMFRYFQGSGLQTLYGVGSIGRQCKFWEWDQRAHPDEEYQLQIQGGQVVARRGQFPHSDIATNNTDVEAYLNFVKRRMAANALAQDAATDHCEDVLNNDCCSDDAVPAKGAIDSLQIE